MSAPLANLKFCSTSLPSELRALVVSKLRAMGGEYSNHLMSDLNYLVVGDRNTDKFRFAVRERGDVLFVSPGAVSALHERWLLGETVTLQDLRNHLLPVFDQLTVCISRVSDKQHVARLIERHGGKVTDLLTVGNLCVVTSSASGKRYEKALEWDIPVVDPQWVEDLVERGAALDMGFYGVGTPNKTDACLVWSEVSGHKRQLEPRRVHKRFKKAADVWDEVMGGKRDEVMGVTRNEGTEARQDEATGELPGETKAAREPTRAVETKPADSPQNPPLFANRLFSLHGFTPSQTSILETAIRSHAGTLVAACGDVFPAYLLLPLGFPYKTLPKEMRSWVARAVAAGSPVDIVTEWFVERSLHYQQLRLDRWGMPLRHLNLPASSPGFPTQFRVAVSGFTGVELLHMLKLVERLGIQFCDTLTKDRECLVVNVGVIPLVLQTAPKLLAYRFPEVVTCATAPLLRVLVRNKIQAAKRWHIPIVLPAFLWEMAETGSMPNVCDLHWCLYAPRDKAPVGSLAEYMRGVAGAMAGSTDQEESTTRGLESMLDISALERQPASHLTGREDWEKPMETEAQANATQVSYDPSPHPLVVVARASRSSTRALEEALEG